MENLPSNEDYPFMEEMLHDRAFAVHYYRKQCIRVVNLCSL
jgi:hypothetical protein